MHPDRKGPGKAREGRQCRAAHSRRMVDMLERRRRCQAPVGLSNALRTVSTLHAQSAVSSRVEAGSKKF